MRKVACRFFFVVLLLSDNNNNNHHHIFARPTCICVFRAAIRFVVSPSPRPSQSKFTTKLTQYNCRIEKRKTEKTFYAAASKAKQTTERTGGTNLFVKWNKNNRKHAFFSSFAKEMAHENHIYRWPKTNVSLPRYVNNAATKYTKNLNKFRNRFFVCVSQWHTHTKLRESEKRVFRLKMFIAILFQ